MRVIFLDIDGVLVTPESWLPHSPHTVEGDDIFCRFDQRCVAQLNRITAETGAGLVVSSTWRQGDPRRFERLLAHFTQQGIEADVCGRTPVFDWTGLNDLRGRWEEIDDWLQEFSDMVTAWCILDDEDHGIGGLDLSERLIRSDFQNGLTADLADRAIALLTGSS